ncbi:MAG: ASCH domain-containing protein [Cystobacter sp.]
MTMTMMSEAGAQTRLKCLTVHQPFAWAIAQGLKTVENRSWPPPRTLLGGYVAIHASKQNNREVDSWLETFAQMGLYPALADLAFGAIIAVVKVTGHVTKSKQLPPSSRPWYFPGNMGWVLSEVRKLPTPIPAQGQLGLWTPRPAQLEEIRRQWKAAA